MFLASPCNDELTVTAFDPAIYDPPATTERRLGYSVAASTLLHVLLIAALAGIRPTLSLLPNRQGVDAPLRVELQGPVVPVTAPETEPIPALTAPATTPAPTPAPPSGFAGKAGAPIGLPPNADSPPAFSVQTAPSLPTGSITVGLIYKPEQVSIATGAKLAQRFPVVAARTPRLDGAVIARYPPEAARARRSARIAAILTIDASGKIVEDDTVLVPDDPMFHDTMLSAVASAKFTPAEVDGNPIAYWVILNFSFDIDPMPGAPGIARR